MMTLPYVVGFFSADIPIANICTGGSKCVTSTPYCPRQNTSYISQIFIYSFDICSYYRMFPDNDLDLSSNYCRNPDLESDVGIQTLLTLYL